MNNWLKFILICLGLIFGAWALFWIIGFVSTLLWYAFILGAVGIAGYIGYQLFKPDEKPKLEEKRPVSQIGDEDIGADRTLEEYRRKYLNK
jgi:4-hydroxybenzoate polyprenyltransferase